jgi:hypothetical protein
VLARGEAGEIARTERDRAVVEKVHPRYPALVTAGGDPSLSGSEGAPNRVAICEIEEEVVTPKASQWGETLTSL